MRRAAAIAWVLLACVAVGGCGRETRHDVRVSVEQLSSIAAEGALMANDLSNDRTKNTFVRVHGEELSSQAQHEAEKLHDAPVDPAFRTRIDKAIQLASDIGGDIDDLRVSPQDREQARKVESDLHRLADESSRLAESL